jgi:hypothetical protein
VARFKPVPVAQSTEQAIVRPELTRLTNHSGARHECRTTSGALDRAVREELEGLRRAVGAQQPRNPVDLSR